MHVIIFVTHSSRYNHYHYRRYHYLKENYFKRSLYILFDCDELFQNEFQDTKILYSSYSQIEYLNSLFFNPLQINTSMVFPRQISFICQLGFRNILIALSRKYAILVQKNLQQYHLLLSFIFTSFTSYAVSLGAIS